MYNGNYQINVNKYNSPLNLKYNSTRQLNLNNHNKKEEFEKNKIVQKYITKDINNMKNNLSYTQEKSPTFGKKYTNQKTLLMDFYC